MSELTPETVTATFDGTEGEWEEFSNEPTSILNVKEEKNLIPPSQNVLVEIKDVTLLNVYKDGEERKWKMIVPKFKVLEGIEVGDEVKYKNMTVDSNLICYFASKDKYDYTKSFYAKQQFLVELKKLAVALDTDIPITMEGVSDEAIGDFIASIKGKELLVNILQTPRQALNSETGKYEDTDEIENKAVGFKKAI